MSHRTHETVPTARAPAHRVPVVFDTFRKLKSSAWVALQNVGDAGVDGGMWLRACELIVCLLYTSDAADE